MREAFKAIHAHQVDIAHAAIAQLCQHMQPEFRAFTGGGPQPQHFFPAFQIDSRRHVNSAIFHPSFVAHFYIESVRKNHAVERLQRPVLLGTSLLHHCVRHFADQAGADFDLVQLLQVSLDLAGGHPTDVYRQDLVVEAPPACLVLPDDLRLELPFRSRGVAISSSPNSPVSVLRVTPFRLFPLLAPSGSCFS